MQVLTLSECGHESTGCRLQPSNALISSYHGIECDNILVEEMLTLN